MKTRKSLEVQDDGRTRVGSKTAKVGQGRLENGVFEVEWGKAFDDDHDHV